MIEIFEKIDNLIAELESLQPINIEDKKRLEKKFRLEFNYNSNHIEGNTLTYGETELLLIFDRTKGSHTSREYDEMKAHDVAYQLIQDWAKENERPLSESDIKNLNKTLLVQPFWKEAITHDGQNTRRLIKVGAYKEYPNSVRLQNGEIFEYTSPTDTPLQMSELLDWFRSELLKNELHPIALAAIFHYKFVRIHPFDDGNGRISRLLMNYVLFKNDLPPVIIKSIDKRNYLMALNSADTGDINAFIEYIVQQLTWSLEISIKAAKGENIEESDDLDKELFLLKKELNSKNVLTEKASSESICKVIEENIFPLFMIIEEKCTELKEYFFDFERDMNYNLYDKGGSYGLGSKESQWEILKQNWLYDKIKKNQEKVQQITYFYRLVGFKKSVIANSFEIRLEIYFNDFNYVIKTDTNIDNYLRFAYDKILDNEELVNIAKPSIKQLIENIKRANINNK